MAKVQLDQDRVLATAADIADREGVDAVSLTRVAKALGISQPALYRYVDGYDDLIRLLGLMGRQLLSSRLRDAAVGVSREDAVRALGHEWRAVVKERPGLYAATDRYPCAGDAELEAAVDEIVHVLAQGLASFELTDDDRVHAARALRSAFHGFAHLEAGDGHPRPHDLDDTFEHILDLLIAGVQRLTVVDAAQ